MHSSETLAAPAPPVTGPSLLLELGRLIIRARGTSPAPRAPPRDRLHAKLLQVNPSTSQQIQQNQPKPAADPPALEATLSDHINTLWNDHTPICIEVLLAPDCPECYSTVSSQQASFDKHAPKALLLERWTIRPQQSKPSEASITSQWLLNAVRSQLHFSQLSAWIATLKQSKGDTPRRRKLSRETCNIKKLEGNCESVRARALRVRYSVRGAALPGAEFAWPPTDHHFPLTDIGGNVCLKVVLESMPRLDEIPRVSCSCSRPRRASHELPSPPADELASRLGDLTLAPGYPTLAPGYPTLAPGYPTLAPGYPDEKKIVDDRMHTPCSESGKHKCSCDDESEDNRRSSTNLSQETKKLDERRIKEIAKYKRKLRKESKLKKLSDSTSSEGDGLKAKETHTSIPILQAARFDRFRAIGCYRNQTYLTLPATRIESKSPFVETDSIPPAEFKKTNTVGTQTDDVCPCGNPLLVSCEGCHDRKMVRSEANYNLASLDQSEVLLEAINRCSENGSRLEKGAQCSDKEADSDNGAHCSEKEGRGSENGSLRSENGAPCSENGSPCSDNVATSSENGSPSSDNGDLCSENGARCSENGARRKCEEEEKLFKKHKCDNSINNSCDNSECSLIKRPKFRRYLPVNRIDKVMSDRSKNTEEMDLLHLKTDDTVFMRPNPEAKRQKTFSISDEDYVLYEKCDYGTFDRCEMDSPSEDTGFKFPDPKKAQEGSKDQVPSPTEVDRFRWRFDSAASMVFHTKTGLPLTSSPAPLRRGNNCFDFDDSINGISGIKSALFHPSTPASPAARPPPAPRPPPPPHKPAPKLRIGPSAGLLGSFEESALQGRLEPAATVHGFTAELGASGAFCPPHRRLPVTVFFYAPGGTNAPYMGHINLGGLGYRVARSGTIQVSLFNPHGTLVKMFVVLYELSAMPPLARTFLRQRTLYLPAGADPPAPRELHKWLRYLIHLRFMTSKSGKLYLHTDIRILVSRKADLDTATAHSALFRPIPTNQKPEDSKTANKKREENNSTNQNEAAGNSTSHSEVTTNGSEGKVVRSPNRVFGGCGDFSSEMREIGYENQGGVSYELRSFTYAPENPRYSPR